ncbi:MAG TPA: ATP-binding protein [Chloroflexota bacterium]
MARARAAVSSRPSSSGQPLPLVENPPNPGRLVQALRELGYDNYSSVLDLIDNSIDAGANDIRVTAVEDADDIVITILDNGRGMEPELLSEALRLGSETDREPGDLGKFGMGLVTASIALGQRVDVVTKQINRSAIYGGFDLEDIVSQNKFVKFLGPASPAQAEQLAGVSGTLVRLSKTDRLKVRHVSTFANTLRRKAGQVFRRFLKAGTSIEVNGVKVEPIDPLMLTHSETRVVIETEINVEGGLAYLRAVDLPDLGAAGNKAHGITAENSGFYVLRNNREIMAAQTFDFYRKHPDFAHFRAELAFDGTLDSLFSTDVRKMSITPSQSLLDRLRQATQALITDSALKARGRANVERGKLDHSVAEANIARRVQLIPKPPAYVEVRGPRANKGSHPSGDGQRQRTPHVTTIKTISGLNVVFNEGDYGEQGPFYLVRQESRTITVTYNREHPFWREFVEHAESPKVVATLDYIVFALANAELLVPEQAAVVKANVNTTLVGLLV